MGNTTQGYITAIRDALKQGAAVDLTIRYLAWGTDGTPNPVPNNLTQLYAEAGRKVITSFAPGGPGVLDTIVYLAPADAVTNIREVALFAGPGATATPNSGIMVARFLYTQNKTGLMSIQVVQRDTITGT